MAGWREPPVTDQELPDIHGIVDAAAELVPGAIVVDADDEGLFTRHISNHSGGCYY